MTRSNSFRRRKRLRARLIREFGRCSFCGRPLTRMRESTLDHAVARVWSNRDANENLWLCCRGCQRSKNVDPPEIFVTPLRGIHRPFYVWEFQIRIQPGASMKREFNYDAVSCPASLEKTARRVKALLDGSTSAILDIGARFIELRETIGATLLYAFAECEFGFNCGQVQLFEDCARKFGPLPPAILHQFLPSALFLICTGRNIDPRTFDECVRLAEAGEFVTRELAQRVNGRFRSQAARRKLGPADDPRVQLQAAVKRLVATGTDADRRQLADDLNDAAYLVRSARPVAARLVDVETIAAGRAKRIGSDAD